MGFFSRLSFLPNRSYSDNGRAILANEQESHDSVRPLWGRSWDIIHHLWKRLVEMLAAAEVLQGSQQEPEVGSKLTGLEKTEILGRANVGHGWSRAGFHSSFDMVPISTPLLRHWVQKDLLGFFVWDNRCFKTNLNNKNYVGTTAQNFYFCTLSVIQIRILSKSSLSSWISKFWQWKMVHFSNIWYGWRHFTGVLLSGTTTVAPTPVARRLIIRKNVPLPKNKRKTWALLLNVEGPSYRFHLRSHKWDIFTARCRRLFVVVFSPSNGSIPSISTCCYFGNVSTRRTKPTCTPSKQAKSSGIKQRFQICLFMTDLRTGAGRKRRFRIQITSHLQTLESHLWPLRHKLMSLLNLLQDDSTLTDFSFNGSLLPLEGMTATFQEQQNVHCEHLFRSLPSSLSLFITCFQNATFSSFSVWQDQWMLFCIVKTAHWVACSWTKK